MNPPAKKASISISEGVDGMGGTPRGACLPRRRAFRFEPEEPEPEPEPFASADPSPDPSDADGGASTNATSAGTAGGDG